jgi:hypothetical protein
MLIFFFNFQLGTNKLTDDDQLMIETCRSAFECFNVWYFKLMLYYVQVHLFDRYT